MLNTESTWTDTRVAMLRELHAEGLAFSLIGARLGITRNACISKAHRIGLDPRPHFNNTPVRRLSPEEQVARAERKRANSRRYWRKKYGRPQPPTFPAEPAPVPAAVSLECHPCSLLELSASRCKWPIGDPAAEDFHFCGSEPKSGKPYCQWHYRIAYQPPKRDTRRPFIQPRWNAA